MIGVSNRSSETNMWILCLLVSTRTCDIYVVYWVAKVKYHTLALGVRFKEVPASLVAGLCVICKAWAVPGEQTFKLTLSADWCPRHTHAHTHTPPYFAVQVYAQSIVESYFWTRMYMIWLNAQRGRFYILCIIINHLIMRCITMIASLRNVHWSVMPILGIQ